MARRCAIRTTQPSPPKAGAAYDHTTRAAMAFIESHLDRPLSVAVVASAAGISARTLQAAFRSTLNTTPTAYIRARRLERVRLDLAEASPSQQATVTEIATRWGINHLGRFAFGLPVPVRREPVAHAARLVKVRQIVSIPTVAGTSRRTRGKEEAVADEREPMAAMKNQAAKEESKGQKKNFTDAFDAPDRQGVMGPGKGPQHRAPAEDGVRAPFAEESDRQPQFSSFDSKGNERVVVLSTNEKGQPAQGTGPDSASAQAAAEKGDSQQGDMGSDE